MRPKRRPPQLKDRVRAQHMLDAAKQVNSFVAGRSKGDLESDPMLLRAVLHALLEIGEAAARMTDAGRARIAGVPWGQVVETRHILIHVYWGVDKDKVWSSATQDIPFLIAAVEEAFKTWPLDAQ